MSEASLLRLLALRPAGADVEPLVDDALRDNEVRLLLAVPAIRCVYIGRRDVGDAGERMIASIWDRDAPRGDENASSVPDRLESYLVPGSRSAAICHRIAVTVEPGRLEEPRILRVFRGEVRAGELDAYVEEVRTGAFADAATNEGLLGLFLGLSPPTGFVTVSAWTGWEPIEEATGGNIRQPMVTRNAKRIVVGSATHYELFASGTRT